MSLGEAKEKKPKDMPEVPTKAIKYYFASEFLVDNFKIPEHRVEDFIAYVESGDFDFTLLNYGRELEFLELLNVLLEFFFFHLKYLF